MYRPTVALYSRSSRSWPWGPVIMLLLAFLTGCRSGALPPSIQHEGMVVLTPIAVATLPAPALNATAAPQELGLSVAQAQPAAIEPGQPYLIGQTVWSEQQALQNVALTVRTAAVTGSELVVMIALQNMSDRAFSVTGELHTTLRDASGTAYEPLQVSEQLQTVGPKGGFAPGGANSGELIFPMPSGPQPFTLHVLDYAPVEFALHEAAPVQDQSGVEPGFYPIDISLTSKDEILAPVALLVEGISVSATTVSLQIAFRNQLPQPYGITGTISGEDAWLLDKDGRQYRPIQISDSLLGRLSPEHGWQPGQAYPGELIFERPPYLDTVRFVFPTYSPLSIAFTGTGSASAYITSATGGLAMPTPTALPVVAVHSAVSKLLARQVDAIQSGDVGMYLATFAPILQQAEQERFVRLLQMPFTSLSLRVESDATLSPDTGNWLRKVPVHLRYGLDGIPTDNVFEYHFLLDLQQYNGQWQVAAVATDGPEPFWWSEDFTIVPTSHFLLFARPEWSGELALLEREVESAYAELAAKGLPLETRYVAFFSGVDEPFVDLTGVPGDSVLGVALSRFDSSGQQIEVEGRAFYLHGQVFSQQSGEPTSAERQQTITHELVHLALAPDSRPFVPPWLSEGLAVYFAGQDSAARRRRLVAENQLDSLDLETLTKAASLGEHDLEGDRAGYEYIYSGAVIAYLVETFGESTVLDFYRAYSAVGAAEVRERMPNVWSEFSARGVFQELSLELTTVAVERFFGYGLQELDVAVKNWLR